MGDKRDREVGPYFDKSMDLCRYIASGKYTPEGVERRWHQAFNCVLAYFDVPKKARGFFWEELVVGNWDRLHQTEEEKKLKAADWAEKLRWEVFYCSDRWSVDRLCRCHWLYRQYEESARGE